VVLSVPSVGRSELGNALVGYLELSPPSPMLQFSSVLVGVVDVRDLSKRIIRSVTSVDVTTTAHYSLFEVPEGKRWKIKAINVSRNSGSFTLGGIKLSTPESYTNRMKIDEAQSDDEYYSGVLNDFELDAGTKMWVEISSFSSAGSIVVHVLYEEYDVG